jgi:hypothetical protein
MTMLSSFSKSVMTRSVVALGLVAAFSTLATTDAEARYGRRHHGGGYRAAPFVAGGILGALAIGAIIHNSNRPQYVQDDGYYEQPRARYGFYNETRYNGYGEAYNVRVRCTFQYDGSCR